MTRKKENKKSDKINLAAKLIKKRSNRGGGTSSASTDVKVSSFKDDKYYITPRGILLWMINDLYPEFGEKHQDWFEKFVKAEHELVKNLSMLSSGGKDPNLFGDSINDMFSICVRCINLGAKYRKALEDAGVDPDEIAGRDDEETF